MGIQSLNFNNAYDSSDRRKISVPIKSDRRSSADRRLIARDDNCIFPNINYTDEVPQNEKVRAFLPPKTEVEEYKITPDTENIFARKSNLPVNITNNPPPCRQFVLTPKPNFTGENKNSKISFNSTQPPDNVVMCAAEVLPPFRRISSLKSKLNNGDYLPAAGLVSIAALNLPEDLRDIRTAGQQLYSWVKGQKYEYKYDYKICQHPFFFFKGTLLHGVANPVKAKNKKLASTLLKADITLAETSFGKRILKLLNTKITGDIETKIESITSTKENPEYIIANVYEGSRFGKLTARAMERTTKIGLLALAALELPKIIKAAMKKGSTTDKIENTTKQTAKSAVNVAFVTAGIAYIGAIGMKKLGPVGSLIGMGVGAFVGSKVSNKVQDFIS